MSLIGLSSREIALRLQWISYFSSLRVSLNCARYARATGRPEFSGGTTGLVGFDRVDIPQQATQPVELVKEMQNDRNAFVIDAQI